MTPQYQIFNKAQASKLPFSSTFTACLREKIYRKAKIGKKYRYKCIAKCCCCPKPIFQIKHHFPGTISLQKNLIEIITADVQNFAYCFYFGLLM